MDYTINWPFWEGTQLQRCPDCDQPIDPDAINIKEGVALCPGCGKLSRLSELPRGDRSVQEILAQPPPGCSIVQLGHGDVVSASLRSCAGFLFWAGFALFWNSILSVFVLLAIAGLYTNLVGPVSASFPAPGVREGKPEMNGEPMNPEMALFLCVFLIPFVTAGVGMTAAAIVNLVGKVEVVIDVFDSYVATGVGFVKWKRRFDVHHVYSVNIGNASWQSDGSSGNVIVMVGDCTIKFGSLLQAERMEWLRVVLKDILLECDSNRQGLAVPPRKL